MSQVKSLIDQMIADYVDPMSYIVFDMHWESIKKDPAPVTLYVEQPLEKCPICGFYTPAMDLRLAENPITGISMVCQWCFEKHKLKSLF